jgi:hypothetical protein
MARIGYARVSSVGQSLGSPRLAVKANRGLAHQEDLDEFSSFFGSIGNESHFVHGFVMR